MISGNVTATFANCKFNNNYAKMYGGAIYASDFAKVTISDNTAFEGNRALDLGDDIYASDTKNNLIISSVSFISP